MKNLKNLLILAALVAGSTAASAASHAGPAMAVSDAKKDSTIAATADMAHGEIRKVDMDNKKITIKHGEIKSLDMPGMTMVFQVKDESLLGKAKVGDKIRFSVEKIGGAFVVTEIQPAK